MESSRRPQPGFGVQGRNVLVHQIEADRMQRQGKAITNFEGTLPAPPIEELETELGGKIENAARTRKAVNNSQS
jgi:hypothetical protein